MKDSGVKICIILKDETPIYQNPRRLSAGQREVVKQIINDWLKRGIIRHSSSEFACPIVLVEKKNGKARLWIDYRKINRQIVRDRFPLQLMEDQLDRLAEARIYSTLDLSEAFFHVPLDEESNKYTAFVTPDRQYEFLVVPFGLCNSPAVFQRNIRKIFKKMVSQGVMVTFVDNFIVPAEDENESLRKLGQVLNMTRDCGLRINWNKCNILVRRVEYLGHIVEAGTVRPSEEKVTAVTRFPKPTTCKAIQCFLGLTGYFIPQYALIARPLSQLLKKEVKFVFADE